MRREDKMFEKLKKLIFDESGELEPENLSNKPSRHLEDSLENNKNLIKAKPIVKEDVEVSDPISKENILRRIDVTQEIPKFEKEVVVEKKVQPRVQPEVKKQVKSTHYYSSRPVISPMFGITTKEKQRTEKPQRIVTPTIKAEEETIISPIYGVIEQDTAELKVINNDKKKIVKKPKQNVQVNMSLEEMLNLDQQGDLEFSLFDVPVDKSEFQSRENSVLEGNHKK